VARPEVAVLSPSRLTVAVPLIALVGLSLAGCSSSSSKKASISAPVATTEAPAPTTDPTAQAPSTAAAGAPKMTIASFQYDPTPLTVAPGAKIPVTNNDGPEHTVTSDVTGLFVADDIGHGKTITFTAPSKPGKYTFHCEYHSSMHGTLIVQ
jgi:plastocyanin